MAGLAEVPKLIRHRRNVHVAVPQIIIAGRDFQALGSSVLMICTLYMGFMDP